MTKYFIIGILIVLFIVLVRWWIKNNAPGTTEVRRMFMGSGNRMPQGSESTSQLVMP